MKSLSTIILIAIMSVQLSATSAEVMFTKDIAVNETFALPVGNYLEWETAQELNTKHFVVERSVDGISYEQLGEVVESTGNELKGESYSYLDINAKKGNNFYRLKIVSVSGQESYSKVYSQNRTTENDIVLTGVSAIEVTDIIKVGYTCTKGLELEYTLLNTQGKVIENDVILAEKDANEFVLSLNSFPAGQYILKFENGKEVDEIVIQKI